MAIASNTAEQLRLRINDKAKRRVGTFIGDGTASAFELGANVGGIVSAQGAGGQPSAFVPVGNTAWTATGATFAYYPGLVTFAAPISANSSFQCIYWDSVFNEAEVDYVTANYGDLNSMHLEMVNTLMMDAYKRAAWAGGGVSYNDSQAMNNLKTMREVLRSAMTQEQGPQGGFESWAEQQVNYPPST